MDFHKQLMAPFVIYADFKCLTVPINKKSIEITQKHIKNIKLVVMDTKIVCQYDEKCSIPTKIYRAPDDVYKLIERLL